MKKEWQTTKDYNDKIIFLFQNICFVKAIQIMENQAIITENC